MNSASGARRLSENISVRDPGLAAVLAGADAPVPVPSAPVQPALFSHMQVKFESHPWLTMMEVERRAALMRQVQMYLQHAGSPSFQVFAAPRKVGRSSLQAMVAGLLSK